MESKRIKEKMNIYNIMDEMSEGNPGAMVCFVKLVESTPNTWVKFAEILDDFKIYGATIYIVWNDYCKQDIEKFKETLKKLQEDKIKKEEIIPNVLFEGIEKLDSSKLSFLEYEKLMIVADNMGEIKLKYIIRTITETGIRYNELNFLTVEAVEKGKVEIYGKVRWTAFINQELQKDLLKYCNEYNITNGPIFFSDCRVVAKDVQRKIRKIAECTDINPKKVSLASFRNLFLEKNIIYKVI